nr:phosphoadenylyl-sulfate reductase [Prochlorococcus sp. MIT 1307]
MLDIPLQEARRQLSSLRPEERLAWAYAKFGSNFALTTSFGIQSAVLLHMLHAMKGGSEIPVIWIDTGYLPNETYCYAEELTKLFELNIKVIQSPISPARMEALYGKLWETNSIDDIEKYHLIRKVKPLEKALLDNNVQCWASGVRGGQTKHRRSMTLLDPIRERLSLRPLLELSQKDIFYYMQENSLPQHPLFEKGYSTVGDWHSSSPEGNKTQGRDTRFGGLKQECGIHVQGIMGEGI